MKQRVTDYVKEHPKAGIALGASVGSVGFAASLLDGNPDWLTVYSALTSSTMACFSAGNLYSEDY